MTIIEARLAAYLALWAVRLLAERSALGFHRGAHVAAVFVRQLRPVPRVIRFEAPAGRQAEVDFARFSFEWGMRYALLVVRGY